MLATGIVRFDHTLEGHIHLFSAAIAFECPTLVFAFLLVSFLSSESENIKFQRACVFG
jgi:hypothetical protein